MKNEIVSEMSERETRLTSSGDTYTTRSPRSWMATNGNNKIPHEYHMGINGYEYGVSHRRRLKWTLLIGQFKTPIETEPPHWSIQLMECQWNPILKLSRNSVENHGQECHAQNRARSERPNKLKAQSRQTKIHSGIFTFKLYHFI